MKGYGPPLETLKAEDERLRKFEYKEIDKGEIKTREFNQIEKIDRPSKALLAPKQGWVFFTGLAQVVLHPY
ncbi:unnamed protein product [Dovyalis caffra]|uniref:Uncharacterized protein n=1 Tax=Dovyalis caffra TaxID=77055 RepID=A0AAV1RV26_9ROSI|nr:unnamed protein product [Dovyalis caffra]